ncbi:MAG: HTH-type transcriptional regulator VirS [Pseudomonadota bacterium]
MSSLPLQRFRRITYELRTMPDVSETVLAETGLTYADVASPEFELTLPILWRVAQNLRRAFGTYWCIQFPALWSLDVHSHLETAVRFASKLQGSLDILERYGNQRWPFAHWRVEHEGAQTRLIFERKLPVPDDDWHNFSVISLKNVETILQSSYPDVLPHVRFSFDGPPPPQPDLLFPHSADWQQSVCMVTIPTHLLSSPSIMADVRAHDMLVTTLEKVSAAKKFPTTARVRSLLDENPTAGASVERVAGALALSSRTLERQLAAEQTSFRTLQAEALKRRMLMLLDDDSLSLAAIAEKLGYSDETALSRAARRWYGKTLSQLRKERFTPTLRAG